jgi:hypothetical protein
VFDTPWCDGVRSTQLSGADFRPREADRVSVGKEVRQMKDNVFSPASSRTRKDVE